LIKKYREPRLMAKFDHEEKLPEIFKSNKFSILPCSRGGYVVSPVQAYHKLEQPTSSEIFRFPLPEHLQSLSLENITSESIALNAAMAAGIMADFLGITEGDSLQPTVCGRMGSGHFSFSALTAEAKMLKIDVNRAQIEIDTAYEDAQNLTIVEAKNNLSESDFLIRQLYYPFRLWKDKTSKSVRPVFLTYVNGIYFLREYEFTKSNFYNSINLVKQARYSIEDTAMEIHEIQEVLRKTRIKSEPKNIPFPQADSFARIINLCEILKGQALSKACISLEYDFTERQADYYTSAGRYLGLIEKEVDEFDLSTYRLSDTARKILRMPYKDRQLAYCKCIFSHRIFNILMSQCFQTGQMPSTEDIVRTMQKANLSISSSTLPRRASTVRGWLDWVITLVHDDAYSANS